MIQLAFRIDSAGAAGIKRSAVMRLGLPAVRIPFRDGLRGPIRRVVGVTLSTGIGGTNRHRQIRPWHAHAVIAAVVHHHVVFGWHMAVDAPRAGAGGRMLVM